MQLHAACLDLPHRPSHPTKGSNTGANKGRTESQPPSLQRPSKDGTIGPRHVLQEQKEHLRQHRNTVSRRHHTDSAGHPRCHAKYIFKTEDNHQETPLRQQQHTRLRAIALNPTPSSTFAPSPSRTLTRVVHSTPQYE